jgi:two-component system, sensor histidine kinase
MRSFDSNIASDLIEKLYEQGTRAAFGSFFVSLVITPIIWLQTNQSSILWWFILFFITTLLRLFLIKKHHATDKYQRQMNHELWNKLYSVIVLISSAFWSFCAAFYVNGNDVNIYAFVLICIAGLGAGSIGSLSPNIRLFYLFNIIIITPISINLFLYPDINSTVSALLVDILFVFFFFTAKNMHATLLDILKLRYENIELIHQLKEKHMEAEKANVSKSKFLAAASHDLRQPLHALSLFSAALDEQNNSKEDKPLISNISNSIESLSGLLNELLDISKLDAGVVDVHFSSINLYSLFNRLHSEFLPLANEKNLKLLFHPTQKFVSADPILIEQILRNLISNAIRYTHSGGIIFGCRYLNNKKLRITVCDTGIGINSKQQEQVFDEFTQLHNPQRDRSKGLGLGLAIVQRACHLLSSKISLRSNENIGSCFYFDLEITSALAQETAKTNNKIPAISLENKKLIFVIDDEEPIRDAMFALLNNWGFDVCCSEDLSSTKIQLAQLKQQPDLIIADFQLPDLETGLQAIDIIHTFYSSDIPAFIITGDSSPEHMDKIKKSPFKLLHKPLKPAKLRTIINQLIKT